MRTSIELQYDQTWSGASHPLFFDGEEVVGQSMKFVIVIINPVKLDDVLKTLHGATVTETKDYGQR